MLEQAQKCAVHCTPLLYLEVGEQMYLGEVLLGADGLAHCSLERREGGLVLCA